MTAARSGRLVFVAGLSGAGKSQAMKALEDLGYYCIDNLPPKLAPQTISLLEEAGVGKIALTLDLRSGGALGDAGAVIASAKGGDPPPRVLFLDARDDVLVRRFSETRRRHPFARAATLLDAIELERCALGGLREAATDVIDTGGLTLAELKERIGAVVSRIPGETTLSINIIAFGFKYGVPMDLDLLFDVRFLRNPNYVDELRPLTGSDQPVAKYVETDPSTAPFLDRLFEFMDFLLPRYVAEGKSQLTIAIGCTGGRHRSVYVARRLYDHLQPLGTGELWLDARDVDR